MRNATHHLRLADGPLPAEATDADLLGQWLAGRDDDAFAALVRRHGPLVMGVCRRRLPGAFDVEDAFQATFLILAQQAERLRQTPTLAPWLHRVAWRTTANLRRRNWWRQWRTGPMPPSDPAAPAGGPEEAAVRMDLDAALLSLPARDRAAVLLCHVQGRSRREAAEALGCPEGTLSAILHRALAKLRRRLRSHDPAAALALAALPLPAELVPRTTLAAAAVRAGAAGIPAGLAPQAWTLAQGATTMEILRRGGLAAFAVIALGVAFATLRTAADDPAAKGPAAAKPPAASKSVRLATPAVAPAFEGPPRDFAASPAVNAKLARVLAAPASIDLREKPLNEALEELAAVHGIVVLTDRQGLEAVQVEDKVPVSINVVGETLEDSLELLLDPLNLAACPRGGVLMVTSKDRLKERLYPRVYPVADLLATKGNEREIDPSGLIKLLQNQILRDDWEVNGGANTVSYCAPAMSLAITHNYFGHRAIEQLLTELRAARAATNAALQKLNLPEIDAYMVKPAPPETAVSGEGGGGSAGGASGGKGGGGGGLGGK